MDGAELALGGATHPVLGARDIGEDAADVFEKAVAGLGQADAA